MTARPIRRNAQTPDRNGKIFYTSTTSLSHISKFSALETSAKTSLRSIPPEISSSEILSDDLLSEVQPTAENKTQDNKSISTVLLKCFDLSFNMTYPFRMLVYRAKIILNTSPVHCPNSQKVRRSFLPAPLSCDRCIHCKAWGYQAPCPFS